MTACTVCAHNLRQYFSCQYIEISLLIRAVHTSITVYHYWRSKPPKWADVHLLSFLKFSSRVFSVWRILTLIFYFRSIIKPVLNYSYVYIRCFILLWMYILWQKCFMQIHIHILGVLNMHRYFIHLSACRIVEQIQTSNYETNDFRRWISISTVNSRKWNLWSVYTRIPNFWSISNSIFQLTRKFINLASIQSHFYRIRKFTFSLRRDSPTLIAYVTKYIKISIHL